MYIHYKEPRIPLIVNCICVKRRMGCKSSNKPLVGYLSEFWLSEKLLRYYEEKKTQLNIEIKTLLALLRWKNIYLKNPRGKKGTFWISLSHHYSRFTLFGFGVTRLLNSNDSLNFSLNFFFPQPPPIYRVHLVSHNYRFNGSTGTSRIGRRKR